MCRFSIFMFTVGNEAFYVALPVFPSPAAQVPPQAARQAQTPRAAPAPHSGPARPTRAVQSATRTPKTPQQQAAAAPPPLVSLAMSSSHRRRPKGRHMPIPLALFAPHPICRSTSDRPQASSPAIASSPFHSPPHPGRSKERMPQGCILYPDPRKKCAKKRRPFGRRFRVRI